MKILVAITSEKPGKLSTLRWAARAGFNTRLFIPSPSQKDEYVAAIKDANYKWHLAIPEDFIVADLPGTYAKEHGYDLLVIMPDDMTKWKFRINHELNPLVYAKEMGVARVEFGKDPLKVTKRFINGVVMERV